MSRPASRSQPPPWRLVGTRHQPLAETRSPTTPARPSRRLTDVRGSSLVGALSLSDDELGFFYGLLGWENVFVLYRPPDHVYPNFERPADIDGAVFDEMDPSGAWRES